MGVSSLLLDVITGGEWCVLNREDSQKSRTTLTAVDRSLPGLRCALGWLLRENDTRMDLSKTPAQYFALDANDAFVALDVLVRQEPDDEEDDEEEEDWSDDEDEDDAYGNDDGYSERPSARVIDSIAPGAETVVPGDGFGSPGGGTAVIWYAWY